MGTISPNSYSMYTGWNMKSVVKLATIMSSASRLPKTVAGTAANMNHLSCWRSSPLAWRSRRMTEKSAARRLINSSVVPRIRDAPKKAKVVSLGTMTPTTSKGFSTYLWVNKIPGMKATPSAVMAPPKIVTHTTIRHRPDGSRPPGNNSIKNTFKVKYATPIHVENHAPDSPQGNAI